MFQIELLTGGVFWVYAADVGTNNFLIYKDDAWQWTPMDWCRPYCPTSESSSRTYLIHHGREGDTDTE